MRRQLHFVPVSVAVLLTASLFETSLAFAVIPYSVSRAAISPVLFASSDKGKERDTKSTTTDPLTKASWYAVEAFGKAFGSTDQKDSVDYDQPPMSVEETMRRIRVDNEREYFLSGNVDALIYDANCVFADPFVSFSGRDRFIENLQNLGSFITKYSAKPLDYKTTEEGGKTVVETRFMVKLELNLPWKPVLAWPWGVRCEIDPETALVVLHQEKWDVEPWEVSCVGMLNVETLMALSQASRVRLYSDKILASIAGSKANISKADGPGLTMRKQLDSRNSI